MGDSNDDCRQFYQVLGYGFSRRVLCTFLLFSCVFLELVSERPL